MISTLYWQRQSGNGEGHSVTERCQPLVKLAGLIEEASRQLAQRRYTEAALVADQDDGSGRLG